MQINRASIQKVWMTCDKKFVIMSSDSQILYKFELSLDGNIKKVQGYNTENIPDQQVIHRLLFAAQKALIDEEVSTITAKTDKYILEITATDTNFAGEVRAITPIA